MLAERLAWWATQAVGRRARLLDAEPLYTWRPNAPWLLHIHDGTRQLKAVLRTSPTDAAPHARRMVAAMTLAERHDVPAPRLIGSDPTGVEAGCLAILETFLPGTSTIPRTATTSRLRAFGGASAAVHKASAAPGPDLPLRVAPIDIGAGAFRRRRAAQYNAASRSAREEMLSQVSQSRGCDRRKALEEITTPVGGLSAVMDRAEERLAELVPTVTRTVLVHGDLHQGNALWQGDAVTGLVDWDAAGVGDPGVDLGSIRLDAAIMVDLPAAAEVLAGWREASGLEAADLPYWDARAALNTPADLSCLLPFVNAYGRSDLDLPTMTARRDAFLASAMAELG